MGDGVKERSYEEIIEIKPDKIFENKIVKFSTREKPEINFFEIYIYIYFMSGNFFHSCPCILYW